MHTFKVVMGENQDFLLIVSIKTMCLDVVGT